MFKIITCRNANRTSLFKSFRRSGNGDAVPSYWYCSFVMCVAGNASNSLLETHIRTARLPGKEPASGRTVSRRVSGRVTGVARVTSQARNAGMRLWTVLMYSSPVPEARHPRPQPDGTAGHARTRSEAVATPETAHRRQATYKQNGTAPRK